MDRFTAECAESTARGFEILRTDEVDAGVEEGSLMLWLIVDGVNAEHWQEQAA